MQTSKKRINFFDTQEAEDIKQKLQRMVSSELYNTESSYTTNYMQYPDGLIPFPEKHMNYINAHPALDASMYLANLRLMTRIR